MRPLDMAHPPDGGRGAVQQFGCHADRILPDIPQPVKHLARELAAHVRSERAAVLEADPDFMRCPCARPRLQLVVARCRAAWIDAEQLSRQQAEAVWTAARLMLQGECA